MAKHVLATPYIRGNSDVITNYEPAEEIAAGTAVQLDSDGALEAADGTAPIKGVAAYAEADKRLSVIESGKSVPVRLSGALTIVPGTKAYITAAGLFTNVSTSNFGTRAVFVSDGTDEVVDGKTGAAVANCALIDFAGGL